MSVFRRVRKLRGLDSLRGILKMNLKQAGVDLCGVDLLAILITPRQLRILNVVGSTSASTRARSRTPRAVSVASAPELQTMVSMRTVSSLLCMVENSIADLLMADG